MTHDEAKNLKRKFGVNPDYPITVSAVAKAVADNPDRPEQELRLAIIGVMVGDAFERHYGRPLKGHREGGDAELQRWFDASEPGWIDYLRAEGASPEDVEREQQRLRDTLDTRAQGRVN